MSARRASALLALLPACALGQAAPELRVNATVTINDPASMFGVDLNIQNASTAPEAIDRVTVTLFPQSTVVDTFGSLAPANVQTPDVGGNNNGASSNQVAIAFVGGVLPGQSIVGATGDFDGSPVTGIHLEILFSDGTALSLDLASLSAAAWGGQASLVLVPTYPVHLTWEGPTENEDGSPYVDRGGFKLFWGLDDGTYANSVTVADPEAVMHTLTVPAGAWYFAAKAYNTSGNESEFSNSVLGLSGPGPEPPYLSPLVVDDAASGLAWLVFTFRNQIGFVEAGTVEPGSGCDPDQGVRGILPTDGAAHYLNLVAVEDVALLPGLDPTGELALFAECSVP